MKKKNIFLSILVFLSISNFVFAQSLNLKEFKSGSEPDGFRGIKWGQDISVLEGMIYAGPHLNPENKVYNRKNNDLEIENVKAKNITYYSWKNKFYMVRIEIRGYENFNRIKDAFFEKFGSQEQLELPTKELKETMIAYGWEGHTTKIILNYSKPLNGALIKIISIEIDKEAPH